MASCAYKLHYFDGRGRAEAIRLIFTLVGEKFDDRRFSFSQWPSIKSEMPLGQVPVLEMNNEKYPQSVAIARYVARQFKLAGKDDLEAMKCDIVVDTMQELNEGYYEAWFHIKDDEERKKKAQETFIKETVPLKLHGAQTLMGKYGNGVWAVGDSITWADLIVYDTIENILPADAQVLDKFPLLKKNREAVGKLPQLEQYIANRSPTPF